MAAVGRVARLLAVFTCSMLALALLAAPALADGWAPRFPGPGPSGPEGAPGPGHTGRNRHRPTTTTTATTAARRPTTTLAPGSGPAGPPPPSAAAAAVHPATPTATTAGSRVVATARPPSRAVQPPVPGPAASGPSTSATTTSRSARSTAQLASAARPAVASLDGVDVGAHHADGLHGQALAALLAFLGLLALGTFLRRFRPPVT